MEAPPILDPSRGPVRPGGRVGSALLRKVLPVLAVLGAVVVLREFEPRGQFFYPRCWLYQLTGILCPGCGGLRATHALLNGDLAAAWRLNPLMVAMAPVAGWVALTLGLRRWRGIVLPNPFGHRYAVAVMTGLAIAFTVGRNWPR